MGLSAGREAWSLTRAGASLQHKSRPSLGRECTAARPGWAPRGGKEAEERGLGQPRTQAAG